MMGKAQPKLAHRDNVAIVLPGVFKRFADSLAFLETEAERLQLTELAIFIRSAKAVAIDGAGTMPKPS